MKKTVLEPGDLCESTYVELSPSIVLGDDLDKWEWGPGLVQGDDGAIAVCVATRLDKSDDVWCAFLVTTIGVGWDLHDNWDKIAEEVL